MEYFISYMHVREHPPVLLILGFFSVVLFMYLPLTSLAYFVYGKNVQPNILQMSTGVINQVVEVLITIHLLMALLIVINPVCQELESLVRVPKRKDTNCFH